MRKVIVLEFITLDGVIQAPGGPEEDTSGGFEYGGWTAPFFDDVLGKEMDKVMKKPFELLLGRKTYDIFSSYWPKHEEEWPGVNKTTKYVASKTLKKADWNNTEILKENVADEVKKLKEKSGPDLQVYGSGEFVQTLLKNDLIDELWLKIFPITLGKGKKLFREGAIPASFTLTESKTSTTGVIAANFKRAGEVKTGSV